MILKSTRALTIPQEVPLHTEAREHLKLRRMSERQQEEAIKTLEKYE
jgi:hypothetical protein